MLATGVAILARRDEDLARVVDRLGSPPLWAREPSFATLVQIILEQQVSLASARAAFQRLRSRASPLTASALLRLSDLDLATIGFSRQKAGYARAIARALINHEIQLTTLAAGDVDIARRSLELLPGIGPWSSAIFGLMAMRAPDVWPPGDTALATAIREVKGGDRVRDDGEAEAIALTWRPWRAVAARSRSVFTSPSR
jgi:DNA-3-methyladenine glycosylase II